ncbi:hypothetical protein LTR78_004558 [Recurvomyces mirabilis]|uniref:Manganese lipoxygenase n=1 Tax=Recurvomyces mirabilis TaxID=574656 RepID=A0AAE1C2F9_9PEZI|nr:hypothetical protein LTR78_004558 [Recurvomyces mirabilis]KAK5152948.1 hypothetical protein LTS14_008056 [Recurvomyces mirabilis]
MFGRSISAYICYAALVRLGHVSAVAVPRQDQDADAASVISKAQNIVNPLSPNQSGTPPDLTVLGNYYITQKSPTPLLRATGILTKALTFLYGPSIAGGPAYPTGILGLVKVTADLLAIQLDLTPETAQALVDNTDAILGIAKYDGLQTVEDYTKLYDGEWMNTLPKGPDLGVLTNYTDDLLFSMERLSNSPYQVRRLNPNSDSLNFQIDDTIAKNITGSTLQQLFSAGRLFYSDYRDQGSLTPNLLRYSAACDAYFYVDINGDKFLPLAIRTNVGSNLIYTPADTANDWLLAKMMYNVNDFWFAQWNHLASTHEVVQIVYSAAIRTISEEHPVQALLNRLMSEVFAIQPLAQTVLFDPGAAVDLVFSYSGTSAQAYTDKKYKNDGSGRFQANYFKTELQNRGLLNPATGPTLKHFPFYEDASTIHDAISTFMTAFVGSYYSSDSVVAIDGELQAWAKECNGVLAACKDFPAAISSKAALVDILTHIAHLASTSHHTINTNELLSISSTLPFHPPALYKPLPSAKGVNNVAEYLPPFTQVLTQFTIGALFARPDFVGTNRSLIHMFDVQTFLSKTNDQTRAANGVFMSAMKSFSSQVSSRRFDGEGLSQGMPFVWQALNPNVMPFSITT